MASKKPKQSPDYREIRCRLLNRHMAAKGWNAATLAEESGQSKATISRMLSYTIDPDYRPSLKAVEAVALALGLTRETRWELFYAFFPEFAVWEEAAENGCTVTQANELLYDRGLPLLTTD